MLSKANILGAATPARRPAGVTKPLSAVGSNRVTCFFLVSTVTHDEESLGLLDGTNLSMTLTCEDKNTNMKVNRLC